MQPIDPHLPNTDMPKDPLPPLNRCRIFSTSKRRPSLPVRIILSLGMSVLLSLPGLLFAQQQDPQPKPDSRGAEAPHDMQNKSPSDMKNMPGMGGPDGMDQLMQQMEPKT